MTETNLLVAMPRVALFIQRVHSLMLGAVAPLTIEQVRYRPEGSSVNTIAGTLFHIACGYERLISRAIKGGQTIYDRDGWAAHLAVNVDVSPDDSFFEAITEDQYAFVMAYVRSVLEEMEAYVSTLTAEQVAAQPAGEEFGTATAGEMLIWPMLFHTSHHFGEISALIGLHGERGLPF